MTFDESYVQVGYLVNTFRENEKYYLSKDYSEATVRKEFIDKLFISLGWDVLYTEQKDPYKQEVKVEKRVNVSGAQKRADYSFSLSPDYTIPKFFVEAKKPQNNLSEADNYFQTIRYGWHKGTSLAILTDFNQFHILDCRFSPDINTALGRYYKRFHYSDYLDKEKLSRIGL